MLIPREVFAVSKCAAKETTRYAINGVMTEREADGMCRATAMDGRRVLTVTWDDKPTRDGFPPVDGASADPIDGFSAIVSMQQWNEAGKLIPKNGTARSKPVLAHYLLDEASANGTIAMKTTDLEHDRGITAESLKGSFLNWRDVMPDYTVGVNAVEIGFNPQLLAELLRAIEDTATDCESRGVRFVVPIIPTRPLVIDAHTDGREATAALMPVNMRAEEPVKASERAANTPIGQAGNMAEIIRRLDVNKLSKVQASAVRDVLAAIDGDD